MKSTIGSFWVLPPRSCCCTVKQRVAVRYRKPFGGNAGARSVPPSVRQYSSPRGDAQRIVVEDDPRYRRVDLAEVHAWEARQAFAKTVAKGESGINLAEAALQIAAEDDAIVSHSTVQLPVHSFLQRITRLASSVNSAVIQKMPEGAAPDVILQAICHHLFTEQKFRVPPFGRSNIPSGVIMDHPGVYENAKFGYLHETLISRQGIPAVLAILLEQVCQQLLTAGAIDFAVRVDCSALDRLPTASALPGLSRDMVTRADGTVLNTCSTDALVEMLRFLKRAYWPFGWQSGRGPLAGGFISAATVWLEGEDRAELQAIARTAKHRLQRGIWTSPGAGDLRRALASTERLCLVLGDEGAFELRDVAALYLHAEDLPAAMSHLNAYAASSAAKDSPKEEQDVIERIVERLQSIPELADLPAVPVLGLQTALSTPKPIADAEQRIPLTW